MLNEEIHQTLIMKLLAVYVGSSAVTQLNLQHGLRNGIWGFKNNAKPVDFETLVAGDLILLATGHNGGGPRTAAEDWAQHSLSSISFATITKAPFKEVRPEWPDEAKLSEDDRYYWRVRFDPASTKTITNISLTDSAKLSAELAEQFRKSGAANGRGYVLPVSHFPVVHIGTHLAMNSEVEIVSQLKALLAKGVPWSTHVVQFAATFGNLNPADIAALDNDSLWKLWTATKFAETGTPSMPTPTAEQWAGVRKMTELLCDRSQSLGERFTAARAVYKATFSADQVQLPVLLRTLLILERGRFGTIATKSYLNPLLLWAGKPELDYAKPVSITTALESVGEIIETWATKVGATSLGDRACIPWYLVEMLKDNSSTPSLQAPIEAILADYLHARNSQPFSGGNPVCQEFEKFKLAISQNAAVQERPSLIIKWSAGQGNWARVPWLVLMDRRETTTTQRGVYCVYLFCQDMSGVYLTFNQGVTEPCDQLGRTEGIKALKNRARMIRQKIPGLAEQGFSVTDDIDLKADPGLGADYETSTIAHKFYPAGAVPSDAELAADLEAVLGVYDEYLAEPVGLDGSSASVSHWIFQGNPDYFDIDQYLRTRTRIVWQARQHADEISIGDKVILWRSGANAGAIAECMVEAAPSTTITEDARGLYLEPPGPDDDAPRCRLIVIQQFVDQPIPRAAVKSALPNSIIIRQPAATNFALTGDEYDAILSLRTSAPSANSFPELLRRYHAEQIVFASSAEKRHYAIATIDDSGVKVDRLTDDKTEERVTFSQAEKLIQAVQSSGSEDFTSFNHTAAVRNTVLQAEPLALSGDQKRIVFLADNNARIQNFCEVLAAMNRSQPLYKPAMLLCVLDGIDSGKLASNQITFDWIAPRFIALMKSLGESVTEQQAAQPFYHLSNDLFWLHAVPDLKNLMESGSEGPTAARKKIKYALLKDTYWNLLQDPIARTAIRHQLEKLMMPDLEKLLPAAATAIQATGFVHEPKLLRRFLGSLAAKPFVILTGNSGTGKTKLAELFAQWLCGNDSHRCALVPVGADWTDNRNVLGYVNHLRLCKVEGAQSPLEVPVYQSTRILDLLLAAQKEQSKPFFLILDEMNLSHVERYFADFLSTLESRDGALLLHQEGRDLPRKQGDGADVPEILHLPRNVFVIGTVNVDETTYMFSPKVLDRANVLEFRIDKTAPAAFLQAGGRQLIPIASAPVGYAQAFLELSYCARGLNGAGPLALAADPTSPPAAAKVPLEKCHQVVRELFALMQLRHQEFAFRTMAEILRFLAVDYEMTPDDAEWNWRDAMDAQILQKVLPKLHGSKRKIGSLLVALAIYCEKQENYTGAEEVLKNESKAESYPAAAEKRAQAPHFEESHRKLCDMVVAVRRDQFVSYIQ